MRLLWISSSTLLFAAFFSIKFCSAGNRQIKCFCDRDSCGDDLVCQGEYCFIGLHRGDEREIPRLRQQCGSVDELPFLGQHLNCEERIDQWQEVCRCSEDFCNTFAYLRSSIDVRQDSKDLVQFTKQDHPSYSTAERPAHDVVRQQNSSLIVLLVIIPLSVGGFAVCLIFLNYHCKMC